MAESTTEAAKLDSNRLLEEIGRKALILAGESNDPEKVLKALETAKSARETRNEYSRQDNLQFWATTLTPLVTILLAVAALVFQGYQFKKTSDAAGRAREDSDWSEAVKNLSFKDSPTALVSVMAMERFFGSPGHPTSSRAASMMLLPLVTNVDGFDSIVSDLFDQTTKDNQCDIITIAQRVANNQWHRFNALPLSQRKGRELPFVREQVRAIDLPASVSGSTVFGSDFSIGAWELDTLSEGLSGLWKKDGLAPSGQDLTGLVLENADFSSVNFSNSDLENAVLANATFRNATFTGANLTKALIQGDVDLCGVTVTKFANSTWTKANWWKANCISPELYDYLLRNFRPPSDSDLKEASKSRRQ